MAAGLGINGAVAFGLVLTQGLTPQGAMGVIVLEGLVVTLLVVVGLREAIMRAVPTSLKYAIGVGIGLFILFIGFIDGGRHRQDRAAPPPRTRCRRAGLPDHARPVPVLGRRSPSPWRCGSRKVPAALLISILVIDRRRASSIGIQPLPTNFVATPSFSTLGQFDLTNVFTVLGAPGGGPDDLQLHADRLLRHDGHGHRPSASRPASSRRTASPSRSAAILLVDSVGAAVGGAAGISSNTSYIESAAGVAEGGRTGLRLGRDRASCSCSRSS